MASSIYEFAQLPQVSQTGPVSARARRQLAQGEAPNVGVIYNPRSHGNQGADFDCSLSPQVHISQPGDRSQLSEALAEFADRGIDLLVINGGDGTVRDVLTAGAPIFGDDWPAIAVLPKGKTNALTVDLGVPLEWNLQNAIDAYEQGARVHRRPIEVTALDDPKASRVHGFFLGAGAFTTATEAGQGAHRLGAFNSMAVAVTILWGIAQWIFSTSANAWSCGAKMEIRLGASEARMAHSGLGEAEWRRLLLASTLERMPAGIKPFGQMRKGLKLAVADQFKRRSLFTLIRLMRGKSSSRMRERGFHQISTPQFSLSIEAPFILDGEAFPAGDYRIGQGPELEFVTP